MDVGLCSLLPHCEKKGDAAQLMLSNNREIKKKTWDRIIKMVANVSHFQNETLAYLMRFWSLRFSFYFSDLNYRFFKSEWIRFFFYTVFWSSPIFELSRNFFTQIFMNKSMREARKTTTKWIDILSNSFFFSSMFYKAIISGMLIRCSQNKACMVPLLESGMKIKQYHFFCCH